MNLRDLPRLARSAGHTRPRQIAARLALTAKRGLLEAASRRGMAAGAWYRHCAPPWRADAPSGPVIAATTQWRPLPLCVDLAGTPWTVDAGMDWRVPALNRGTRLEKLNLHYMKYLHELNPKDAVRLMADWAVRVPPFADGYWKDTWNSYALSIRVTTWLDILSADPQRLQLPGADVAIQSAAAQVRFLAGNLETDIGGNHIMKNLRALLRASSCLDGDEPQDWAKLACRLLAAQLAEQVLPDGMHFERSPAYHLQVMEDLLDIRRCMPHGEVAIAGLLDDALVRMNDVAERFAHPDGDPSLFADGGLHMAARTEEIQACLRRAQEFELRPDQHGARPWRLPDAGYVGLASPASVLIVDCGPVGADHLPAHGHGDALAIEWSTNGRRFLVDAGVFEYHAGARRAYARSTAAHNTVTLDDQDQSEFWSAFRVGRRARVTVHRWEPQTDGFALEASHDGYRRLAGKPTHVREIVAGSGRIEVRDRIEGGRGQRAVARLLLAPDVRVTLHGSAPGRSHAATLSTDDGAIRALLTSEAPIDVEPAEWNPDFGVSILTQRITLEIGRAPCRAAWSIAVE
jgi:uncharacterized heparinase superfamily protein